MGNSQKLSSDSVTCITIMCRRREEGGEGDSEKIGGRRRRGGGYLPGQQGVWCREYLATVFHQRERNRGGTSAGPSLRFFGPNETRQRPRPITINVCISSTTDVRHTAQRYCQMSKYSCIVFCCFSPLLLNIKLKRITNWPLKKAQVVYILAVSIVASQCFCSLFC